MSYYRFRDEDIIDTHVLAHPAFAVQKKNNEFTGSVYLEKEFLTDSLLTRRFEGFSAREGGIQQKVGPFTASVTIVEAEKDGTNKQFYNSILQLYDYYSFFNSQYTSDFTGSETTSFRVLNVPEIYYDRTILTGSFSASDFDSTGQLREVFDDGRGGIYSGSVSGTLVGNIFYNEGLVVLKGGGFNDPFNAFGETEEKEVKWTANFKGTHRIPVKIFRCRAGGSELNASTNTTFYTIPTGSTDDFKNEKVKVLSQSVTYVTAVGLYNDRYELVGLAKLGQPVKKPEGQDIQFRVRLDM